MRFTTIISIFAAVLLLSACETVPEEEAAATGTGASGQQGSTTGISSTTIPAPRPGTQEDLVVNYGDRVFFDFDKYDLKAEARQTIEGWAEWLNRNPTVTVTIEGHADERGTREYNLALGERRATSVKNYLVALGVDPNRIATISYGKERPAVLGHNEAAWAQNRRAVMVVNS